MGKSIDTATYRIAPGSTVDLGSIDAEDDGGFDEEEAEDHLDDLLDRLDDLQERLYAESSRALLIVFQAMDTGGKDSTIRETLGPLNPQGVRVWNFKTPTPVELEHDFLWRVHQRVPGDGYIGVFNRSHYEDVLVVRVKGLVGQEVWLKRYDHINAFEKLLADEGTTIVKFYLHITKEYQKERLQRRLDRADKQWKFNPDDLKERPHWDAYMRAYEDAVSRCSTEHAPWYVIPAQTRWYRDALVGQILVETLERMDPRFPEASFDRTGIVIE